MYSRPSRPPTNAHLLQITAASLGVESIRTFLPEPEASLSELDSGTSSSAAAGPLAGTSCFLGSERLISWAFSDCSTLAPFGLGLLP